MSKTRVNIEDARKLLLDISLLNNLELHDIDFYADGKKLTIPDKMIYDWRYVWLINTDFVEMWLEDWIYKQSDYYKWAQRKVRSDL